MFLKYSRLDFPLERFFSLKNFVIVANQKQNLKKLLHVPNSLQMFCSRVVVKSSKDLEI